MKLLPSRIAGAVARTFNRLIRPLPEFPLDMFARRKDLWIELLRNAMQRSGRGFRHWTMKRQPPAGASRWRGARRPDKVEAAERALRNPVFTGKLNYRRSDKPA